MEPPYRTAGAEVAAFGLRRAIELLASFFFHFQQRRAARMTEPLDLAEVSPSPS